MKIGSQSDSSQSIALSGNGLHIKAYKLMTADLACRLGLSEEDKKRDFVNHLRQALAMLESRGFVFPPDAIPCAAIRDERRPPRTTKEIA